jgi:hypothetical protein
MVFDTVDVMRSIICRQRNILIMPISYSQRGLGIKHLVKFENALCETVGHISSRNCHYI